MHDSRGAALKVGDRVLIEAKVTALCSGDDTGYCNVTIDVVTPQQTNPPPMTPPTLSAINTRMLTKVAAVFMLLLAACSPAFAQQPCVNGVCPAQATAVMSPAVPLTMAGPGVIVYADDEPRPGLLKKIASRVQEIRENRPKFFGGRCR